MNGVEDLWVLGFVETFFVCGVGVARSITLVIFIELSESEFSIDKVSSVVSLTILLELMISVEVVKVVFLNDNEEVSFFVAKASLVSPLIALVASRPFSRSSSCEGVVERLNTCVLFIWKAGSDVNFWIKDENEKTNG